MSISNPYEAPIGSVDPAIGSSEVPEHVVTVLRATRPWVLLLSIIGFLGAAFMVVAGLGIFVFADSLPSNGGHGFPKLLGLVYVPFGAVYFVPALFLFRYASAIGELVRSASVERLADALEQQKSFWKFVGILTAIMLVIAFGGGFLAVVTAALLRK